MTVAITDIQYLRKMTGAGMMDCKNALEEAKGNYDKAVEIIRKKGRLIVAKRENHETYEGCVLAASKDSFVAIVAVKCETDFVAKGKDFIGMVKKILNIALENKPNTMKELENLQAYNDGRKVQDLITENIVLTGENAKLGNYEYIEAPCTAAYTHTGNRLASIVGFDQIKVAMQVAKDIAMQVAAMNPISVDKSSVAMEIIENEKRITREKAIEQGKFGAILDRIVEGALNKYYRENTLLLQDFVKDSRITVSDYLRRQNKDLSVIGFRRVSLNVD